MGNLKTNKPVASQHPALQQNKMPGTLPSNEAGRMRQAIQMQPAAQTPQAPVNAAPSQEQGMNEGLKGEMENAFGTDFSQVRLHTESSSATQMGALAYTQGENVHFAPGQFNPGSRQGKSLLGHELAHVVQQRQGRVNATRQLKGIGLNDDSMLEKEADLAGERVAGGGRVEELDGGGEGPNIQVTPDEEYDENYNYYFLNRLPGQESRYRHLSPMSGKNSQELQSEIERHTKAGDIVYKRLKPGRVPKINIDPIQPLPVKIPLRTEFPIREAPQTIPFPVPNPTPLNFNGVFIGSRNTITPDTLGAARTQINAIATQLRNNPTFRLRVWINTTLAPGAQVRCTGCPFNGIPVDQAIGVTPMGLLWGRQTTIWNMLRASYPGLTSNRVVFIWRTNQPGPSANLQVF